MVWSIEGQLEEYKAEVFATKPAFCERDLKERYKVGLEVIELSDLLLVHLREICTNLEKAMPQNADRLKGEHDKYYAQKIPGVAV